jgi:predicted RNA-binding Zn-ribbon protein involved in translation (DUF1610 family)|tara:strand:+ start:3638 stop:3844 length:207 start_codon:yes stop_codon:yes gene_type:complete
MKKIVAAVKIRGTIDPKHEIEIVCASCNFDIDENELSAEACSDCGQALILKQNILICATTIPAAIGSA